jgi:acyl-CoA reductase-like NAD-dependent aldehyde dehydrogenase
MHHGQICFSTERIIVLESVADKFIAELKKKAPLWHAVDGVNERMVENAHALLKDAKDKGATFLVGGPDRLRRSALQPTIVTEITKDMSIRDTESFGPSASLYIAKDEDEAIKLANDTTYGLNAAIHTKDIGRALRVGRRIECAQVRINEMTVGDIGKFGPYSFTRPREVAHSDHLATNPIGGMKNSGWGRSNNKWGLAEFLQTQTILLPIEKSG